MIGANIREAVIGDAGALAAVHVRSWQHAYRGLLPDSLLDGLDIDQRAASWRRILGNPAPISTTLVADVEGATAGFCSAGPSRDEDATRGTGEIFALYDDPGL